MFLWLKLLAFGVAFLRQDAFVKAGDENLASASSASPVLPPPAHSTSLSPPAGDENLANASSASVTSPPPARSTSLSPPGTTEGAEPAATTPDDYNSKSLHSTISPVSMPANTGIIPTHTIEAPIVTTEEPCADIEHSITSVQDGKNMAEVTLKNLRPNIRYVILETDKNFTGDSGTYEVKLQRCMSYTVEFENCTHIIPPIPPESSKSPFKVEDQTNTSAQICWDGSLSCANVTVDCTGPHVFTVLNERCKTLNNLSPNHNYSCNGNARFFENDVVNQAFSIITDHGVPEAPEDLTVVSHARNVSVEWKQPSDISKGPIDGYVVTCNSTDGRYVYVTNHVCQNLVPYEKGSVSVTPYTKSKYNNSKLMGKTGTCYFETKSAEPQPVIDVNATLTADNAVQIKCKSQQVYGPERVFELTWENGGKEYFNNSYCDFKRENLLYLTNYTFTILVYNGEYRGQPVTKSIRTRYNSKALIIFLAFLIVVTSLALLLVLYKIYDLHKKKLSNSSEGVNLVTVKDDDRQLLNIEPIPSEQLLDTYKRKIADEGRLFLDEFQSIPRVFTKFSIKEAKKSHNQNKNRYIDILPYDHNRVELSEIPGDLGSDYINASYIDGFKEPRKYIAAQGPKDETTDDFWRMIWEQKATIIVMVTRCEEGKRVRNVHPSTHPSFHPSFV